LQLIINYEEKDLKKILVNIISSNINYFYNNKLMYIIVLCLLRSFFKIVKGIALLLTEVTVSRRCKLKNCFKSQHQRKQRNIHKTHTYALQSIKKHSCIYFYTVRVHINSIKRKERELLKAQKRRAA